MTAKPILPPIRRTTINRELTTRGVRDSSNTTLELPYPSCLSSRRMTDQSGSPRLRRRLQVHHARVRECFPRRLSVFRSNHPILSSSAIRAFRDTIQLAGIAQEPYRSELE
jgi:hypothetical protein